MLLETIKLVKSPENFPDVSEALMEPDGLLAYSLQLTSTLLLHAYSRAIFPWYEKDQPVLWWSPSKRAILVPSEIKYRKSLKQSIRKNNYTISLNKAFNRVIQNCSTVKRTKQNGTWITQDMISHYQKLHQLGFAHSIECWQHEKLVGGLYGIYSQGIFCGESMFSLTTDASKTCLLGLAQNAQLLGINFIDCQIMNPYLDSMGAKEISRKHFLSLFTDTDEQLLMQSKIPLSIQQ